MRFVRAEWGRRRGDVSGPNSSLTLPEQCGAQNIQGDGMPVSRSPRTRIAGQSAMSVVVAAQSVAPGRGVLARAFGVSPLSPDSRTAYNGALGELLVGDVLDNLGPSWDVLHDLPLADGVLDHLAIGPAGVFAIHVTNTLDRDVVVDRDTLVIAGQPNQAIIVARAQARAAARRLSEAAGAAVRVRPVLVVVAPRRFSVRVPPATVRVIPSYQLDRTLTRAPRTLDGAQVACVSDFADLRTTWPDTSDAADDVERLNREFALVRALVRAALARRVIWGVSGIVALYAVVWALVAAFVSIVVAN
jgi:hypothetical protein